jgi:hypothetical protein
MAYDEGLATRIRDAIGDRPGLAEQLAQLGTPGGSAWAMSAHAEDAHGVLGPVAAASARDLRPLSHVVEAGLPCDGRGSGGRRGPDCRTALSTNAAGGAGAGRTCRTTAPRRRAA